MTNLNTRQFTLHKYLLKNSNRYLTRQEILNDLKDVYGYENEDNLYYSKAAVILTKDIKVINENDVIQKIIVSNSKKGIKIATEQEAKEELEKEYNSIIAKLTRYHKKMNKAKLDGQMRLKFGKYEREFIESFVRV